MKGWLKYLFEIIAIFIGITGSFLLDEWREDNQNRDETVEVLKLIKSDLQQDTLQISELLKIKVIEKIKVFLDDPDRSSDTLRFWTIMRALSNADIPTISNTGYSSFANLQKIILKNDSLFILISSYYNNKKLDNLSVTYMEESKKMVDYIENNFSRLYRIIYYANSPSRFNYENFSKIPGFIKEVNLITDSFFFRNKLSTIYIIYDINLLKVAQQQALKATHLLSLIDKEIHR